MKPVLTQIKENINIYTVNNQLIVELNNQSLHENPVVTVHDISGKVVFKNEIKSNQKNKYQLNIPSGVYICEIQNPSFRITEKIFVK